MIKTTISVVIAASLMLLGAQFAQARGFGGAHASGGYHGSYSAGGYHEGGAYARGPEGAGAVHGGASGEVYHGADGTTVAHGSADVHGAAAGPDGAAAGGKEVSGTVVKGPEGNEYTHESSVGRGVAAGPEGVEAGRYGSSGSTYHGADGATYAHGTAGYSTVHTALPTDAGYGMPAARTETTAYAGNHQTEAVSGSVYAARGASVRTAYSNPGLYGADWHAANPGAWTPAGWTAGQAWATATWPTVGASLGWSGIQPVAYNYGTNVTYQDNQVYYGNQPVATAEQYYQQASTLAGSAPALEQSGDWLPLGVFALVQKEQSDPHYVMHLAINKSGAIGGNYSDWVSGTTVSIQGAVDKKTQRAAWTVGKNKNTVCETGLYNLTKDEAPALIHMGKDKTQQWLLVRLKQPELASSQK
ncbi:MAG: hypothetical protein ABSG53_07600 [Thermoguttaceae bacterium]|jgi:hypothetical protein